MYWDIGKLLSFNALLNFVIGERGVGKSFASKRFIVNDAINNENEFVYIRRYKTELEMSFEGFFDQLQSAGLFPNVEFKIQANKKKVTKFLANGKVIGYAMSLSTANILKSASFPHIKTIMFDEFLIDKGCYHYLQNEVTQFLDVIETVARLRDIRVLLLGNAVSVTNPYFNYFNLSLPYGSEFKTFKNGTILVNYIKNEAYREAKKESRFGQLIDGTEYGRYAIDNQFLRDSKSFIGKRDRDARQFSTIIIGGAKLGVWRNWKTGNVFISKDFDPSNPCTFAFTIDDHNESTILMKARTNTWFKPVLEAYKFGKLFFENQKIKNETIEVINKCML